MDILILEFPKNKNKTCVSLGMTLPTLKLYHIDPTKMGWPLKTMSRTGNNGKKILTFLKISCNLPSLCTVIWGFDILYYFPLLCFAISYLVNYLLFIDEKVECLKGCMTQLCPMLVHKILGNVHGLGSNSRNLPQKLYYQSTQLVNSQ